MFLFFVGCDGGPLGGIGDGSASQSLNGVKVLTKPADFDFSGATGEKASENYYGLFAREIMYALYNVYEKGTAEINEYFNNISTNNGETYKFESDDLLYVYSALRYTIEKIEIYKDSKGVIVGFDISFDDSYAWEWNADKFTKNSFELYVEENSDNYSLSENKFTVSENYFKDKDFNFVDSVIKSLKKRPESDYLKYFASEEYTVLEGGEDGDDPDVDYWYSPYYQKVVEGKTGDDLTVVNFYQDALEYVTYLFVLGYDYEDKNGNETADASLFDFEPTYDAQGTMTDIKVGGWGSSKISVVDALINIRQVYKELGNYIGVTQTNKEQVKRFILDRIIGAKALEKNIYTIDFVQYEYAEGSDIPVLSATQPEDLTFNRNYVAPDESSVSIIDNIIDYACLKAPIGYDKDYVNEDGTVGKRVLLDECYVASKITDYEGDYFFASYDDNDDSEMFKYIDVAEYQSMVLCPQDVDLGKPITDIWLAFEYYEKPQADLIMKDSIKINVGFRYFNSSANGGKGQLYESDPYQIEVKYGKNGDIAGENPDVNWVYIGASSIDASQYDISIPTDIKINTQFNNNIGNGVINPFVSGTTLTGEKYASKLVNGDDYSRKYYKLNDSSSYGAYGSLNEEMFSVENAGSDASDFMEVYFDIVKEKGVVGVNYSFKVALILYAAEEEV